MKKFDIKKFFKSYWEILKGTFSGFGDDRGMKLSASLAYYTIFSIGPLLILILSIASIAFGNDAVQGKVFTEIKSMIGPGAAHQVQDMLKVISLSGKSKLALGISIATLLIGASSIFIEIQDSINIIWGVKAKPKRGWLKLLKDRLLSSSLIFGLGFLLLVSMMVNAVVLALSNYLAHFLPDVTLILINVLNVAITFVVITSLFSIIFKYLPDVNIKWKDVLAGAIFTSLLFMLGRYGIGLVVGYSIKGSAVAAAGSIVVILLWIYYTAAILYLGAEFTKYYGNFYGIKIQPADYAVFVEIKEIEPDYDKGNNAEEKEKDAKKQSSNFQVNENNSKDRKQDFKDLEKDIKPDKLHQLKESQYPETKPIPSFGPTIRAVAFFISVISIFHRSKRKKKN